MFQCTKIQKVKRFIILVQQWWVEYFCSNRHLYSRQHFLFYFLLYFLSQKTGVHYYQWEKWKVQHTMLLVAEKPRSLLQFSPSRLMDINISQPPWPSFPLWNTLFHSSQAPKTKTAYAFPFAQNYGEEQPS